MNKLHLFGCLACVAVAVLLLVVGPGLRVGVVLLACPIAMVGAIYLAERKPRSVR